MATASYVSDLSDIFLFETTTGVSATGGGGAGLSASVDFAMEGTNSVNKSVGTSSANEHKGFMYDNGSNFSIGADDHFFEWLVVSTPGLCRLMELIIGDDTSNYRRFGMAEGSIGELPGSGIPIHEDVAGDCYAARYTQSGTSPGGGETDTVGSPGSTPSWIGIDAFVDAPGAKSANVSADAARIGTGYDITGGTGADPEANFAGIASDDQSTSEGIFQPVSGGYRLLGKLRIGSASTACEFLDSSTLITIKVCGHTLDDFSEILVENASTIVTLDDVTFRGLWTWNRGRFEMITSAATVDLTGCVFQDFGDTILGTGATCLNCAWINTDTITANGADLTGSLIRNYEEAADTSPLIWNVATDPDGLLDDMTYVKGTLATHAIEFGTSSPTSITLRGIDFQDYNSSDAQNDSTFHVKRTSGTVTITCIDCTGNLTYKTAGANVIIIDNPVTFQLHVTDIDTAADIQNARAFVTPSDNTATYPWEESVTITRVTTTASVAHNDHNLSNGNKVFIEGADQEEYNGVQTITNVTTNAYDYTVSGSPTTPATGTITSTAVFIDGLTDASGLISDFRPYPIDQPITGRVRKSSSDPFYITAPIVGTIDDATGLEIAVQMVKDQ